MSAPGRHAQVTVEFALTLPLVAALVCAILEPILELSFAFYRVHCVNTACRMAERRGAVGASDAELVAIVQGGHRDPGALDTSPWAIYLHGLIPGQPGRVKLID